MGRQLSLVTRRELVEILKGRYANADREGKQAILDEFVAVSDYHRKHAIRVLGEKPGTNRPQRIGKRIYDEAVLSALIVLWEAADRICGKRLKVLLPVLIDAMERHGHLQLAVEVRSRLLRISAATIDRMLSSVREKGRRRRSGVSTALRKAIPVRTFGDWKDPAPGSMEADFCVSLWHDNGRHLREYIRANRHCDRLDRVYCNAGTGAAPCDGGAPTGPEETAIPAARTGY
jgi:hypothetical protein